MKKVKIEADGFFGCLIVISLMAIWIMAIVEIVKQLIG